MGLGCAAPFCEAIEPRLLLTTYYASPSGGGSGLLTSSPFLIHDFWAAARPGDKLLLLDGHYTGVDSMIRPTKGLKGASRARITISALHDGKAHIDGEGVNSPLVLSYNDYFTIEGLNISDSVGSVVYLGYSNYNIVRRVAAWDAADGNTAIFGAHGGTHNLFEDDAGWGTGRKVFTSSQGGDYTTFRRCWGRWEGCTAVGPKMVFAFAYNAYHNTVENCIGTWDARKMPETYTLMNYDGTPWTGSGAGVYTNYTVQGAYGIFAVDGYTEGRSSYADAELLGCTAYTAPSSRPISFISGYYVREANGITIKDCASFQNDGLSPFYLANTVPSSSGLVASHLSSSSAVPYIHHDWQASGLKTRTSNSDIRAEGGIINPGTTGATIKNRTVDGVLTTTPLWPWPMDQRIYNAMIEGGYSDPIYVSDEVASVAVRPGDANWDGAVNVGDLGIISANYGKSGHWSRGDFSGDGVVNIADLAILAHNIDLQNVAAAEAPAPTAPQRLLALASQPTSTMSLLPASTGPVLSIQPSADGVLTTQVQDVAVAATPAPADQASTAELTIRADLGGQAWSDLRQRGDQDSQALSRILRLMANWRATALADDVDSPAVLDILAAPSLEAIL